ncbi:MULTISPECIES: hypothetical protein [Streptomyces]|uniref:Uncharacterized protein n=1 Tax=Streptomyces europaeiscabiei TaxID=146819 RepID=A0ABU4NRB4_9ACTN|nr:MULTISPECIES: hypothetical protein [Streptomyces]MDX3555203.1 hypothetical protein [Streptomyces europaeiscabiei]MDX3705217.1 hypothetical protein [Streptomyces europaeiscabiei]MDX3864372.1 hypothetical protein [Streptomyces europaeiscabiei]MDX3871546.1 hypothetical protein [Streptomyces europaeiscabiei]
MGLFNRNTQTETDRLATTVADLPPRAADWTPQQLAQFTEQSNRAMREQNGLDPNAS